MPYEHFSRAELECRCGRCEYKAEQMSSGLMAFLVWARKRLGFPFPLTSGIRCPAHNKAIGSKALIHTPYRNKDGSVTFHSVDIGLSRARQWALLELAVEESLIVGIGIKMHGADRSRLIHLDDHPMRRGKRAYWTYP